MSREGLAVQRARKAFQTGRTKPLEFRLQQLKSLLLFIAERRSDIAAAVKEDLGKVSWVRGEALYLDDFLLFTGFVLA